MQFKLMENVEEFEALKKGDMLLVKWSEQFLKHNQKAKQIALYNIAEVRTYDHEVICERKRNHYFNYNMYLRKEEPRYALEIYKVIDE